MADPTDKQTDAKYFPLNYADSRRRFQEAAAKLPGAETGQWPVPGKTDNDLFVDFAYWPALKQCESLFVVTSGIHGSETYCGSAIQQMLLQEVFPGVHRDKVGFLFVHAMNPFGFKHHQRTTEAGVNLNRNFSVSGKLFSEKNEASDKMHEIFFSKKPVSSTKSKLFESLKIKDGQAFFGEYSMDEVIKGISPGQHERPEHIEFGGKALEPQSRFLTEKMRTLMPLYRNIIALDLHTGLGHRNRLHLLTTGSGEDLHPELFAQILDPKADEEFYEHTPASAEGFYETPGAINSMFVELANANNRVCAITMEFGTLGHDLNAQLESLNSFVVDHQGQYFGFMSPELAASVKKENFERSYPQRDDWRIAVVAASRGMFKNMLRRLIQP